MTGVFLMTQEGLDTKTFKNPKKPWNYEGEYTIELTDGVMIEEISSELDISGRIIHVTHGRIRTNTVGFMFHFLAYPFGMTEGNASCIRDNSGEFLWVNKKQR